MAFKPVIDYGLDETVNLLLQDSLTYYVGDVVAFTGGTSSLTYVTNASGSVAGNYYVFGVIQGFRDKYGNIYPSTGADPLNTPATVTTGATNVATVKLQAVVLPIKENMIFEADLDATAGTTTYSDLPGVWFDLVSARQLDESTAILADNSGGPLQVFSLGTVKSPETSTVTKVRVKFSKANLIGLGSAL